jgi:transcriptional regulator with XRE-family HTH domain
MNIGLEGFPRLLREWRQKRRWSQLDLALTSGVSQRHISFLESARANPSRAMILQLSEALEVPLRERNLWLTAAGFAPLYAARTLDDPQMAQVMGAVRMMLAAHEPFPALALDRAWNVLMANRPFEVLVSLLGADIWARVASPGAAGTERNLMRLFFHPQGIRPLITNWSAVGPLLWQRATREAHALGGNDMQAVLEELAPFQEAEILWSAMESTILPVVPFKLAAAGQALSLFAVIATFGTAQDVTTDELRIETLFPADAETEALFRAITLPPAPPAYPAA